MKKTDRVAAVPKKAWMGRPSLRAGVTQNAYPGKTVQSTWKLQPDLRRALLRAQQRSQHSIGDILHACCFTAVTVHEVTAATFR